MRRAREKKPGLLSPHYTKSTPRRLPTTGCAFVINGHEKKKV